MVDLVPGVKLPWVEQGQDFGASACRPRGGVSQADRRYASEGALLARGRSPSPSLLSV